MRARGWLSSGSVYPWPSGGDTHRLSCGHVVGSVAGQCSRGPLVETHTGYSAGTWLAQ